MRRKANFRPRRFKCAARQWGNVALILVLCLFMFAPIFLMFVYSFEQPGLIAGYLQQAASYKAFEHFILKLWPQQFSLHQYTSLLFEQLAYIRFYLNSVLYAAVVVAGQIGVGAMVSFALSFFAFRYRDALFFIYLVLMLLPFQITMVPSFISLRWLNLIDTYGAIWMPGIFAPFAVFMIRQFMVTLPVEVIEAGTVDGANPVRIFSSIVAPMCKSAMIAAAVLVFADTWNIVEQPMVFLKSIQKYPLSLALFNEVNMDGAQFAAAALYLLPPLLLFLYFQEDIIAGIQFGDLK